MIQGGVRRGIGRKTNIKINTKTLFCHRRKVTLRKLANKTQSSNMNSPLIKLIPQNEKNKKMHVG